MGTPTLGLCVGETRTEFRDNADSDAGYGG